MSVLICKNISSEGPGTIEDFLRSKGIPYTIVDLSAREALPVDMGPYDTLVMLGGPMSVNDDLPYIRDEEVLVRDFAARGKKMFGVCLGAQIMAKALGAQVRKGPGPEVGWLPIKFSEEGLMDPLIQGLATHPATEVIDRAIPVFHWHGETFDIPVGALRLACSELYQNQAFRYGKSAYGFQFHIEVSERIIYDWMAGENIDMGMLKIDTDRYFDIFRKRAFIFYEKFFGQSII
ncbi:MAG TPA: type 1 glutamine amidotransferase [Dissulfurispiraceae bacterium]|nr:type 1 glutamine amidotransferase [Dissulfurispiraceae bacterium]